VVGAGVVGGQQDEHQIHRLAIQRIIGNRRAQAGKQPIDAVDGGQLAVGNGNALADAGGAQLFAGQQGFKNDAMIDRHKLCHGLRQILKELFLALRLHAGQYGAGIDNICEICHACTSTYAAGLGSTQPMLPSLRR